MDWLTLLNHRLKLAQELTASDWLALTEAWLRLLFFRVALRAISYALLEDSVRAADTLIRRESRAIAEAERLRRLIHLAAQIHLAPTTCLVQSLTLQSMLKKRDIPAQIRIGAQKTQGAFHAHAWVEIDGMPIGESEDVATHFNALKTALTFK